MDKISAFEDASMIPLKSLQSEVFKVYFVFKWSFLIFYSLKFELFAQEINK